MYTTYEEYLKTQKSISVEQMEEIHKQIIEEIKSDSEAEEIYDDLVKCAVRYATFRSQWFLWSKEEKMQYDSDRSACHNSMIVKFNMLSRYLKMQGKEAAWRDRLGYEEDDAYNRKVIGDFACYIVFINSINAR